MSITLTRTSLPEFRPFPLLRGGHAQTLAAAVWPLGRIPYRAQQQRLNLSDGDQVILHDDRPAQWNERQRCVLLVHGLGGSHLSPYMIRLSAKLTARGYRVFRLDLRGCGAGERLAQHPGHAGRSEDVLVALQSIQQQCGNARVTVIGFSLGANIVLKLAGEHGEDLIENADSLISVAPPIDLHKASKNIALPANRFYDRWFVKMLHKHVRGRREFTPALRALNLKPLPKTLYEFDDRVTAVLSGFAGVDDYYQRCSSAPLLANIAIPAIILVAEDDPLIPAAMFREVTFSPSTELHMTRHGGHLGYLGVPGVDPDRHWMDWRICEWVQQFDA